MSCMKQDGPGLSLAPQWLRQAAARTPVEERLQEPLISLLDGPAHDGLINQELLRHAGHQPGLPQVLRGRLGRCRGGLSPHVLSLHLPRLLSLLLHALCFSYVATDVCGGKLTYLTRRCRGQGGFVIRPRPELRIRGALSMERLSGHAGLGCVSIRTASGALCTCMRMLQNLKRPERAVRGPAAPRRLLINFAPQKPHHGHLAAFPESTLTRTQSKQSLRRIKCHVAIQQACNDSSRSLAARLERWRGSVQIQMSGLTAAEMGIINHQQ